MTRAVLSNLQPGAAAGFVAMTLELWLRQHSEALGPAALDDLASALDVRAELDDLRRSR